MHTGDLSSYLALLKRRLPMILLMSVVAALVGYGVASRIKPSHIVHFSYTVSLAQRDNPTDFRFDGYYALQATDLFASTLAGWMKTPEHVVEAYREAGLTLPSTDARDIVQVVDVVKSGPQLVQVAVKSESKIQAEALASGLRSVIGRQVKTYHDKGIPAVAFTVVADTPWTGLQALPIRTITSGVFVFVFLFLLNGLLLMESIKKLEIKK
ncbi:MAG: hypothetical protein HYZ63_01290 [Candidatus Andersenbacteria bacterium]|nr:hypothetical protein [Candidatus Andersenbacteria bacterium]